MSSKRNEDPKEIMTIGQNLPSEILNLIGEDNGFEDIREHVRLPYLKIVQGLTSEELQDQVGGPGSVAAVPGPIKVMEKGGTFEVIPVFFWNSFHVWSDLRDKESPMFLESSFDTDSNIARRAKSPNAEDRTEAYGPGDSWTKQYCHHFNFAVLVFNEDVEGLAATMSFCKGEWSKGRRWMNQMYNTMRGTVRVPLYLQRWEFSSSIRDRGDKKWFGFEMMPAEQPVVSDVTLAESLIAQHNELKQAHNDRRLSVAVDEETGDESTTVEAEL